MTTTTTMLPRLTPRRQQRVVLWWCLTVLVGASWASAFVPTTTSRSSTFSSTTRLQSATPQVPPPRRKGYIPKWKKKKTLAEQQGAPPVDLTEIGLKGNVKVVFVQGNATKTTMALAGQPLRDVATQAGQFIKYGCGKGECGTCESLVNGQWIRPCSTKVPALAADEAYVVQVKQTKAQTVSSGRFYSVRSIVLGFWNNLLGMIGFVRDRRLAKKNWNERREYEDLVAQKTLEKKQARLQAQQPPKGSSPNPKLKP